MPAILLNEWVLFHIAVISLLVLDLGIFNRKSHVIELKEAIKWSIFWISLGLAFGAYIYFSRGMERTLEYYTAYLVEESLSVDNLFVFAVIFNAFKVERKNQHRLLFWGIVGAVLMRSVMIISGSQLLIQFHTLVYIFGAILLFTGFKLIFKKGKFQLDPQKSKTYRIAKRYLPITDAPHNGHFFKYDPAKASHVFTLYFIALLVIESTDVLFAIDSVPAVLAISKDPFVVYTSNICAVLGLRALFFVLEDLIDRFYYLQPALGITLAYVGAKMLLEPWVQIPIIVNLSIILTVLLSAIVLSLLKHKVRKLQNH